MTAPTVGTPVTIADAWAQATASVGVGVPKLDPAVLAARRRIIHHAVPEPLSHQAPIGASDARFKALRCGRRFGKTRFALTVAFRGHGPVGDWDGTGVLRPKFRGITHGYDVVWVAQDYPNLTTVVWREEFKPRFEPLDFCTLNAQQHNITVDGLGTLFCRPETAINGIRGIGKRLGGVIIDEAAWLDLEHALQDVIMAALIDNEGWLILMSTTNAGPDGNQAKRVPSYFNLICEQIRAKERSAEWEEFTGTAFDNPSLKPQAIRDLIAEYPAGSPKLDQEVYAKLLRAGVGVALAQVCAERHLVPRFPVPAHWTQFGAFDWGFNHPYSFGWYAADEDGNVVKIDTIWGIGEQPGPLAAKIEAAVPIKRLRYIVGGLDLKNDVKSRGEYGPTLWERFVARGWKLIEANVSRIAGLNNLRLYVEWQATDYTPEKVPQFTMMDTPGNRWTLRVLEQMQVNPDNLEDALKVDALAGTGADGFPVGGDDPYDETRYALMSRPCKARALPRLIDPHDPTIMAAQGNPTLGTVRKLMQRDDLKRRARIL